MRLRDRVAAMSRKEEIRPKSLRTTKHAKKDPNQWVLIAPEAVVQHDNTNREDQDVAFVKLKHPKTGKAAMFMFSSDGCTVHELLSFKDKHRSWFIDETVQEDGSLMMATPVDPLFLILPYLVKADSSGMYITLDQILDDDDYPQCYRLLKCSGLSRLHCITSVKGTSDVEAYRFNLDKTLDWLKAKVENLAWKLEEKDVHVSLGSQSATFVRSSKGKDATKQDYLRYATGMISDYITSDFSKQLFSHLGIQEVADKKVVESEAACEPASKKAKLSTQSNEPAEDYSKNFHANSSTSGKPKPKMSAAQRALSKVDTTGMKSIASFFGKPKKSKSTK